MLKRVIDVSVWNGDIDWNVVKNYVDGAIIQCGYGNDIQKQDDKKFKQNYAGCQKNNIPCGAYLFSYAKNHEDVVSETKHILRLCKGKKWGYPIFIDIETDGVSGATFIALKDSYKYMLDELQRNGLWCGLYTGEYYYNKFVNNSLLPYTNWIAGYGKRPKGMDYAMWQYTSEGQIEGIKGKVDVSECYIDFPALMGWGAEKPENAPKPGETVDMPKPIGNPQFYTVKSGDTLWDIAKRYGTRFEDIVNWNSHIIPDPNLIFSGQIIRVK